MGDVQKLLEALLRRGEILGFSVEGNKRVVLVLASKAERVRRLIADSGGGEVVIHVLREYPKIM